MKCTPVLVFVPSLLLAGCAPVDPGFGEAFRWDVAQQVIDPDPVYEGKVVEGGSGQHSAAAVDRYNKGTVKTPVPISSTSSGGTGSGSGSSGSSSGPK